MNFQVAAERKIDRNEDFIQKAESLKPTLKKQVTKPINLVKTVEDPDIIHGWKCIVTEAVEKLVEKDYGKGDSFIVDFGQHQVGYVTLKIRAVGSPPDAPLHIRLTFGEMPVEVAVPFSTYNGWISSSWLQEETIHVDVLPETITLPRRYSFRYMKVEILDTSQKYRVAFDEISCETVTSADNTHVPKMNYQDSELEQMDRISIKTLEDCMQDVFEDGPKRDRRLWLGDLRLQALANYETFQSNDLVKRCLYLFAGVPNEQGQVSANLFIAPTLVPDDTYLYDYSLFFTTTLYDYYEATNDQETLEELWPLAYRQVELALERLDERGIVTDSSTWWAFIDWHEELNKQAPSQAILIYTLRRTIRLAELLDESKKTYLELKLTKVVEATLQHLWDEQKGFFVSGDTNQVSWASQIWMVLAEVLDQEENRILINQLFEQNPSIGMNTPYMYHHLVEALLLIGDQKKAVEMLRTYWGGMIKDGADTFWELYNPNDKAYSPYGSHLINSYCHAWSCTPTYLIRRYGL
ncbi:alpha-L-rhamnosidase-related protein [Halalkalibacter akibai]|uniref:Alfa-L-rhamnosidase n=1 Tax=Halalkalibacter akibai (strain ATCC 43226 / DSM 21942 / CIP 109018 / JCM 9157 / 1139) TaxID=1236973 RepID=W4QVT9_HALA3|nr:family 78 glycoside hydrolase catalytic domain [Halalkalibacter akibai]GAE36007.1 alfa-L-rhamnosidase [Halalkalibacter akibai JCM 9157]